MPLTARLAQVFFVLLCAGLFYHIAQKREINEFDTIVG